MKDSRILNMNHSRGINCLILSLFLFGPAFIRIKSAMTKNVAKLIFPSDSGRSGTSLKNWTITSIRRTMRKISHFLGPVYLDALQASIR